MIKFYEIRPTISLNLSVLDYKICYLLLLTLNIAWLFKYITMHFMHLLCPSLCVWDKIMFLNPTVHKNIQKISLIWAFTSQSFCMWITTTSDAMPLWAIAYRDRCYKKLFYRTHAVRHSYVSYILYILKKIGRCIWRRTMNYHIHMSANVTLILKF